MEKLPAGSNLDFRATITSADMEPITRKTGAAVTAEARQSASEGQKTGPSKFDLLRADLNQKLKQLAHGHRGFARRKSGCFQ